MMQKGSFNDEIREQNNVDFLSLYTKLNPLIDYHSSIRKPSESPVYIYFFFHHVALLLALDDALGIMAS